MLAAVVAVSLAASCAELSEIETDRCGNGVVEVGEDCDGVAARVAKQGGGDTACAPQGSATQCRYACTTARDCPIGWGCDLDLGTCATSNGELSAGDPLENGAVRMVSGDFDGDGRRDLVLAQPSGFDGNASASAYFFTAGMRVRERRNLPIAIGAFQAVPSSLTATAVARGSTSDAGTDGGGAAFPISDLSFSSSFGVGVLRGAQDQPFSPELLPYQSLKLRPATGGNNAAPRASQILVIPKPAKDGSFRGQVQYVLPTEISGGAKAEKRATIFLPFSIDQTPDVQVTFGSIEGAANLVRFATAPAGEALCFRGDGCAQALVWSDAEESRELLVLEAPTPGVAPKAAIRIPIPLGVAKASVGDVDGDGIYDIAIAPRAVPGSATEDAFCPFFVRGSAIRAGNFAPVRAERCGSRSPFVGMTDLNGDGVADLVYGTGIAFSSRAGDAGAAIEWKIAYQRTTTPWTRMEVGDFDGDGRTDAILAVDGQSGLDVVRGATGEVRLLTVPTPEPIASITTGFFDADRMVDVAYTTKVARAESSREASAYIVFGGPENETYFVGRKTVSQLVNLRRPLPDAFFPDADFLGLVQDTEVTEGRGQAEAEAVLYTTYVPQGRAAVSVLRRERGEGIGGRAETFGSFGGQGALDALQIILRDPAQCGAQLATLQTIDDVLSAPTAGGVGEVFGIPLPYGPFLPIALAAGRGSGATTDDAFVAYVRDGSLVVARVRKKDKAYQLEDVHRVPYAPARGACGAIDGRTDAFYPQEQLSLLDLDDDGDLDLVFTDGGRVQLAGGDATRPGLLVILRNDGGTYVPIDTSAIGGRGFAKIGLGTKGSALAVLGPREIGFYRLDGASLAKVQAISFAEAALYARSLEAGDFDGDGIDDLAMLSDGALTIYRGKARAAGAAVDGGAP